MASAPSWAMPTPWPKPRPSMTSTCTPPRAPAAEPAASTVQVMAAAMTRRHMSTFWVGRTAGRQVGPPLYPGVVAAARCRRLGWVLPLVAGVLGLGLVASACGESSYHYVKNGAP